MKKLFSMLLLMGVMSCSTQDEKPAVFDWHDAVSNQYYTYSGNGKNQYLDFDSNGEAYKKGIIGSINVRLYYDFDLEYENYISVWFGNSSDDDNFRIYKDGRVYFSDFETWLKSGYTKQQIESLSTNDMVLLIPEQF